MGSNTRSTLLAVAMFSVTRSMARTVLLRQCRRFNRHLKRHAVVHQRDLRNVSAAFDW